LQAIRDAGKILPVFEMEEKMEWVRGSGEIGIVYIIGPDAMVVWTLL
jgi:hypothetical protein